MFYQFNNFTGRLIGAHGSVQPYYPLTSTPLNKQDPPKIVFGNSHVKFAEETVPNQTMSSRTKSGTKVQYGKVPESMLKAMEKFQVNDGVPVYLKGGPMDKVLLNITFALCAVGVAMSLHGLYKLSFPKEQ